MPTVTEPQHQPIEEDDQFSRVELTAANLRGLAHPLRIRLLTLLRQDGPSTATKLAARVGESSGATSYHLRQLARHGFVADDAEHGSGGRERWWRAVHHGMRLSPDELREAPTEARAVLRALVMDQFARVESFLDELPLPESWDGGRTVTDFLLRLSPDEAAELREELVAVLERRRQDHPAVPPPPGTERVVVQVQMLPELGRTGG